MGLPTPEDATNQFGGHVRTDESDVYIPADKFQNGPLDYYLAHPSSLNRTPHLFEGESLRTAWEATQTDSSNQNTEISSLCGGLSRNVSPAGYRREFDEIFFHVLQLLSKEDTIFAEAYVGEYPQHSPNNIHALLCNRCESTYESRIAPDTVIQELTKLKSIHNLSDNPTI